MEFKCIMRSMWCFSVFFFCILSLSPPPPPPHYSIICSLSRFFQRLSDSWLLRFATTYKCTVHMERSKYFKSVLWLLLFCCCCVRAFWRNLCVCAIYYIGKLRCKPSIEWDCLFVKSVFRLKWWNHNSIDARRIESQMNLQLKGISFLYGWILDIAIPFCSKVFDAIYTKTYCVLIHSS